MSLPVIVLGSGGHAKVLIDILRINNIKIIGTVSPISGELNERLRIPWLGDDDAILQYSVDSVLLVNGIGSVGSTLKRRQLFEKFKSLNYNFSNVIHPSAILASDIILEEGIQLMAGVVVQTGSHIGRNSIVNTGAIIDHNCWIGEHVHIAPRGTLSGGVFIGNGVHIGTGASIIQNIRIGTNSIIGAGAVVTSNISEGVIAKGIPAKEEKHDRLE
jgi:sugar O-acyltransferase (sialic acid O-acetyltransferase NeuD family)